MCGWSRLQDSDRMEKVSKRVQELETVNNNMKVLEEMMEHSRQGDATQAERDVMKVGASFLAQLFASLCLVLAMQNLRHCCVVTAGIVRKPGEEPAKSFSSRQQHRWQGQRWNQWVCCWVHQTNKRVLMKIVHTEVGWLGFFSLFRWDTVYQWQSPAGNDWVQETDGARHGWVASEGNWRVHSRPR